ncbi:MULTISPECIES: efflux RND transporter periplasmic adaptor subunit [unclassified Beijerinckia]|uniref:efflux RND transporter periplasmic adaptor subunit n=1 Tax=unclassified Beijerinckia TaxID=2638183 RepID=UPI000898E2BE|nr:MULTISPECIES: efflux RND transporter periplasmic adaptor subunit [unclassified Beijerinckia]MDH7793966.1 HlyD family secretion protein [Beijerinckia sp. GAS462]SEB50443.1 RND family efflux transporter, MFP subunit [Beijerinckia sp. 28-YEA-48]
MRRSIVIPALVVLGLAGAGAAWKFGSAQAARPEPKDKVSANLAHQPTPQPVTVVAARAHDIVETVLATGTLVARNEVLIGPEIEGLRIVELLAEEGDKVEKGAVLVRLQRDALDAQLAQSDAALTRADAAIGQATNQIAQSEANAAWTKVDVERARSLLGRGASTQAAVDQKNAAALTGQAQLRGARDALDLARADKASLEAQRRELQVRIARTEVRSPSAGVISRRSAKLGAVAAAAGDPLFRIVENGTIELEAEVPEARMGVVKAGQKAVVTLANGTRVDAHVRLAASEVDRNTRLGRVRLTLVSPEGAATGSFARGLIEIRQARALTVPISALSYDNGVAQVLIAVDGVVRLKPVQLGLVDGGRAEVLSGLTEGEEVVARAGSFLRPGDLVAPVRQQTGAL